MLAEKEAVKLQLAMAFGQGAGAMLANAEALDRLLAERGDILVNAMGNWSASRWPFIELVRTLGQLSAARAAAAGSAEIRWVDVESSIQPVLELCPCIASGMRSPQPGR
jgi:hypothetical protein